MYSNVNMTVKVNRKDLLLTLSRNFEEHKTNYSEAKTGFTILLEKELKQKLRDLKNGQRIQLTFENQKPENHTKDYDDIIGMLKMSVDDTVTLDYIQYQQYINDEWDWKSRWNLDNSVYISTASVHAAGSAR